ncbi:MAG: 3-dehydroquinate synthase II, partial [bacterium]|nr:3-dehydroquinate synthase II [bacterium]
LTLKQDVLFIEIKDKKDEQEASRLSKSRFVIVKTTDWTVIPLENMVAGGGNIIAQVRNEKEARTALQVLEKGVSGVFIIEPDPLKLKRILKSIHDISSGQYRLEEMIVKNVKQLGMSDRVCIDTTTNMKQGEGMLTGNSSACMFLVHSESLENPYVAARPFRVNAGAVHAYVLTPDNKTKYLSELKSGDPVLLVNHKGESQVSYVGRIKIEKRPMLLIEARYRTKDYSVVLQNAETIRLTQKNGRPISVVQLKKGDKVLAYIEEQGRHFGLKISETITEK